MGKESEDFKRLREAFGRFGDLSSDKNESGSIKYEISFSHEFDKLLVELANKKGINKAEVIRRAVASYAVMQRELASGPEEAGWKISITNEKDEVLRDVELP